MIPVQELRVGNWVYESPKTKFPMYVTAIGEDWVQLNFPENEGDIWESEIDEIEPIPIDKNVLEKIGMTNYGVFWSHEDFSLHGREDETWEYQSNNGTFRHTCIYIRYVHEIQNWYFMITGKLLKT